MRALKYHRRVSRLVGQQVVGDEDAGYEEGPPKQVWQLQLTFKEVDWTSVVSNDSK